MRTNVRLLTAGLLAVTVAGCGKQQAGGMPSFPPVEVEVAEVLQRPEATWSEATGRVWAVEYAEVRPRVAGLVEKIAFTEGALVKAGDPLFLIDEAPFRVALQGAEARAADARARRDLAKAEVARAAGLIDKGGISREFYEQRTSAAAIAEASLQSAEAAVAAAKLELGYTRVTAPIAGRAGVAAVKAGNLVSSQGPVLVTLVSVDPVHVIFDLDERTWAQARALYAGEAAPPLRVGVEGDAGYPREARLDFADNRVDPATGTIRLRAVLANTDGALTPGGFARVRVQTSVASPRTLIEERALLSDQGQRYVLVMGPGDIPQRRILRLGQSVGDLRIVEGLQPGDLVLVNGLARVFPNAPVKPTRRTMGAPVGAAGTAAEGTTAAPTKPTAGAAPATTTKPDGAAPEAKPASAAPEAKTRPDGGAPAATTKPDGAASPAAPAAKSATP